MRTAYACERCGSPITADARDCEVCAPVGEPESCSIFEIIPSGVRALATARYHRHVGAGLRYLRDERPASRN